MQVSASIDESDIGRIRPQQQVTFKVDAYPDDRFTGTVTQVRLQPSVVQNVTTYNVIVDVPNTALKLTPGMTANVNIEVAASENVVRVPNAALRFRPTTAMFTALGQAARVDATGDVRRVRLPFGRPQGRQADRDEVRLKPDTTPDTTEVERHAKATAIDALFDPLSRAETQGRVWIIADNELKPVPVTLGLSDGKTTELINGDLQPDAAVVTNVTTGTSTTPATAVATKSPFTSAGGGFGRPGGGGRQAGAGAAGR